MTGTPSWLYHLFGVLMLAVAAYCFVLLVVSVKARRLVGLGRRHRPHLHGDRHGRHVHHRLGIRPGWAWELTFFVADGLVRRPEHPVGPGVRHAPAALRRARTHELRHADDVRLPRWRRVRCSGSMAMAMSGGRRRTSRPGPGPPAGIRLLRARRSSRWHRHGRERPPRDPCSCVVAWSEPTTGTPLDGASTTTDAAERVGSFDRMVATPWLEDASHVVMCVAMGLMLILMI